MDDLAAWLTLAHAPSLHAGTLRHLQEHLGSVTSIVTASPSALRSAGASSSLIEWLQSSRGEAHQREIGNDLRWLQAERHHFLPLGAEHYPALLADLPDAPVGLFVRGDPAVLCLPQLAIVGSRNPTTAGAENAVGFAAHLARCGLAITSGLAIGIDAAAHRGALDADGITIAVCGTGIDLDYPRANAELARAISERGAVVSEFPLGMPAIKSNFPRRNRIISGLSLGTLVVEAAPRSGSLITARLAIEQGREVFAIPGSIHNPLARGCHQLIRQGAKLVETADDIFAELGGLVSGLANELAGGWAERFDDVRAGAARPPKPADGAGNFGPVLDKEYEILLDALGFEPASVDVLVARSGLRPDEVASMLLILELDGSIESRPGGLYVRRVLKAGK